ncbi:C40 family peptidase [Desulfolucanica intricata]|uniref:C40 family peptidase n=1 Tax=Desulfolucanica intricata TaxID=1285191 RepID=UPI000832C94E|nr:LysM peptidoglycan-binding domain-containing protein [Desulfolucanica intricata]
MSKTGILFTSLALGISLCILPNPSYADTTYTVKQGDSLWKISQDFNTTVNNIQTLNNLSSTNIIPGQKLLIIKENTFNKPLTPVIPVSSDNQITINTGSYYTVQQGDTLWNISQNFNTTISEILSINNLTSTNIIPGQKLLIVKGNSNNKVSPPMNQVSRNTDRIDAIINYAKSFIGVPYKPAGISPGGFDCSGYLKYVFANFNIDIPRTAAEQYHVGQAVSSREAKPGDFVAFKTGNYISHIGIYLGNGEFISATSSKGVAIAQVYGPYWGDHLLGFSRVIS